MACWTKPDPLGLEGTFLEAFGLQKISPGMRTPIAELLPSTQRLVEIEVDGLPSLSGLGLACPQLSGRSLRRSTCVGHGWWLSCTAFVVGLVGGLRWFVLVFAVDSTEASASFLLVTVAAAMAAAIIVCCRRGVLLSSQQ